MRSSYIKNKYDKIFEMLIFSTRPKKIVEFGILDGFSLKTFFDKSSQDCQIEAYDLFEDFPFNTANYEEISNKFKSPRIKISKADYYDSVDLFEDESIDLLHIDIANNGETYNFAINNYLKKVSPNGLMILEGGSTERDNIDWMIKFDKPKIKNVIDKYKTELNILTIEDYPSVTIIKK